MGSIDRQFFTQRSNMLVEFTNNGQLNAEQLKMAESLTGLTERTRVDDLYARNVTTIDTNADIGSIHKFAQKAQNFFCWFFNATQEFRDARQDDINIANTSKHFKNATVDLVWAAYKRLFTAPEALQFGGRVELQATNDVHEAARIENDSDRFEEASAKFHDTFETAFTAYVQSEANRGAPIAQDRMGAAKKEFMEVATRLLKLEGKHSHFHKEASSKRNGVLIERRIKEQDASLETVTLPDSKLRMSGAVFAHKVYARELDRFAHLPIAQISPVSLKIEVEQLAQINKNPGLTPVQAQEIALRDLCDALMGSGTAWTANGRDWNAEANALDGDEAIEAAVAAALRDRVTERQQKTTRLAELLDPRDLDQFPDFDRYQELFTNSDARDAQGNVLDFNDLNSPQIRGHFKSGVVKAQQAQAGYETAGRSANVAGNPNRVLIRGDNGAEVEVDGQLIEAVGQQAVDAQGAPIANQVTVNVNGVPTQFAGAVILYPADHLQAGQPQLDGLGRTHVRLAEHVLVWGTQQKLNDAAEKYEAAREALRVNNNMNMAQFNAFIANNNAAVDRRPWENAFRANIAAGENIVNLNAEIGRLRGEIEEINDNIDEAAVRAEFVEQREERAAFLRDFVAPAAQRNWAGDDIPLTRQEAMQHVFNHMHDWIEQAVIPAVVPPVAAPAVNPAPAQVPAFVDPAVANQPALDPMPPEMAEIL